LPSWGTATVEIGKGSRRTQAMVRKRVSLFI